MDIRAEAFFPGTVHPLVFGALSKPAVLAREDPAACRWLACRQGKWKDRVADAVRDAPDCGTTALRLSARP